VGEMWAKLGIKDVPAMLKIKADKEKNQRNGIKISLGKSLKPNKN
jgi:hypothetical protein